MMEEALASAEDDEGEDEPESEDEVVAGDVPDWLSDLAPEQPVSEAETEAGSENDLVNDSEFTWMTDEALANAESASEAVDPEFVWMVSEPESEFSGEAEAETASVSELEVESEPEAVEAISIGCPIWSQNRKQASSSLYLRKRLKRKWLPQMISIGCPIWSRKRQKARRKRKRSPPNLSLPKIAPGYLNSNRKWQTRMPKRNRKRSRQTRVG